VIEEMIARAYGSSRGTNGLPDVLQVSPIRACRSIGPGSLGG
jgi:hypothetical protein